MKINILTIFPEMFSPVTTDSILGRANQNGLLEINLINIRDYSEDKHKKTDDTPFGGGVGMTMTCQPIFSALRALKTAPAPSGAGLTSAGREGAGQEASGGARMIYMSPRGRMLDEDMIRELSRCQELTVLCGHYEGVDQRVLDYWGMEEISIGDYVLTGGELPAMVLIDAVSRFIPGVLGDSGSAEDESVYSGLLEADQYTKPRSFEGMEVPQPLFGGNHLEIELWQLKRSLELTAEKRPDLLEKWIAMAPALPDGRPDMDRHPAISGFTRRTRSKLIGLLEKLRK